MKSYEQEMGYLEEVVREAGIRVQHLAERGFEVKIKPDGSQVTTADLEVDRILKERLLTRYPQDGWLSEETPDDRQRLDKTRVWILDPIDGTRCFVDKVPEYVISIALVENSIPVLAIIFNPSKEEMYVASRTNGCHLNGKPAHVRTSTTDPYLMLAHVSREQRVAIQKIDSNVQMQSFGSIAYAMALVAGGKADSVIYPGHQNEWDIAAGTLLVQEAGGVVVNRQWEIVSFNQEQTSVSGVIATSPEKTSTVQQLLEILKTI